MSVQTSAGDVIWSQILLGSDWVMKLWHRVLNHKPACLVENRAQVSRDVSLPFYSMNYT